MKARLKRKALKFSGFNRWLEKKSTDTRFIPMSIRKYNSIIYSFRYIDRFRNERR